LQIPTGTRDGCAVPIDANGSQLVTVSINGNRGACVDPQIGSYGQVSLTKTITSGTSTDGETDQISAQFPSAPGLVQPSSQPVSLGNQPVSFSRSCAIPGYSRLSAGPMSITSAGQNPVTVSPTSTSDGVVYQAALPQGSIAPGQVQISSSAAAAVQFQEAMPVGIPITILTNLALGTYFSALNPLTIQWSGGDSNSRVVVSMVSGSSLVSASTLATTGAVTLQNACQTIGEIPRMPVCSFGIPPGPVEIVIEVLPASGLADSISAQGVTQKINFTWSYRYVFGGLSTGN
jgi:hypothetical protein